ncbi:MAG: hypothetical protein KDD06_23075 [Phaeodactylibacter sp.]|nr:hypothetical protein [Phaeodactylibacter sp.]
MRYLPSLFILICLGFSINLSAQSSPVGEWKIMVPDRSQEGAMIPLFVTIKADNIYWLDFGGDGNVEGTGKYVAKGNQMIIQDAEGSECTGKGIYTFEVTDKSMTMTRVSDECEGRGGPDGKMEFSRR